MAFNPNQPRVPKGSPDSGEWSSVGIRKGKKVEGKQVSLEDIAAQLDKGGPLPWEEKPGMSKRELQIVRDNLAKAEKAMEEEVLFQMQQANSGLDWYEEDVGKAFAITMQHIPQLQDPRHQTLFSVVAGIMSPSTYPDNNWKIAAQAYEEYLKTGVMPGRNPENGQLWMGGLVSANKEKALNMLNALIQEKGGAEAVKWLVEDHSALSRAYAVKSYGGQTADEFRLKDSGVMLPGFTIFGPKVGPFVASLSGADTGVPVDRWATRTFNRYFKQVGTQVDGKFAMRDMPTDKQRSVINTMMSRVASRVGLKPKQVQSVSWFYEQQLYSHLGSKSRDNVGYSKGAEMYDSLKRGS